MGFYTDTLSEATQEKLLCAMDTSPDLAAAAAPAPAVAVPSFTAQEKSANAEATKQFWKQHVATLPGSDSNAVAKVLGKLPRRLPIGTKSGSRQLKAPAQRTRLAGLFALGTITVADLEWALESNASKDALVAVEVAPYCAGDDYVAYSADTIVQRPLRPRSWMRFVSVSAAAGGIGVNNSTLTRVLKCEKAPSLSDRVAIRLADTPWEGGERNLEVVKSEWKPIVPSTDAVVMAREASEQKADSAARIDRKADDDASEARTRVAVDEYMAVESKDYAPTVAVGNFAGDPAGLYDAYRAEAAALGAEFLD